MMSKDEVKASLELDAVGIVEALRRVEGHAMTKRRLYLSRRRLERERVGRWHFEYERLMREGVLIQSGSGTPRDPFVVRLASEQRLEELKKRPKTELVATF
jgi:hypothetical protein